MNLADAVTRYAQRFHRAVGPDQHVASPLGAWLVLALAATAATGSTRDELEEVLGCDVAEAYGAARALLEAVHPAVLLAAAAWTFPGMRTADLTRWLDDLSPVVERGPIPSQDEADRWAADRTLGLIREFPISLHDVVFALATALATKISWTEAFRPFAAERVELARAPGFDEVGLAYSPARTAGRSSTRPPGRWRSHTAASRDDDLVVVSVIADPSFSAAEVLDLAHPIAIAAVRDEELPGRIPLWDLPLGNGHSWRLAEHPTERRDPRPERYEVVLPAWSVESTFDLLSDARFGFVAAAHAVMSMFPSEGLLPKAVQAAVARYTRTGFEAAALTVLAMRMSAGPPKNFVKRVAQLEFTHPYAVVAVARGGAPVERGAGVLGMDHRRRRVAIRGQDAPRRRGIACVPSTE